MTDTCPSSRMQNSGAGCLAAWCRPPPGWACVGADTGAPGMHIYVLHQQRWWPGLPASLTTAAAFGKVAESGPAQALAAIQRIAAAEWPGMCAAPHHVAAGPEAGDRRTHSCGRVWACAGLAWHVPALHVEGGAPHCTMTHAPQRQRWVPRACDAHQRTQAGQLAGSWAAGRHGMRLLPEHHG